MSPQPTYADVLGVLTAFAPLHLQESYDNSGLLVGEPDTPVRGILFCLDVTEQVVDEAKEHGCNLIVSHHPPIFTVLRALRGQDPTTRCVLAAIRHRIGLMAMHTNLDSAPRGVSYELGSRLGLIDLHPLKLAEANILKLVTFVPESHAETVREALFAACAGTMGEYSGCSFNTSGQGTFTPSATAQPYVGKVLEPTRVDEIRIETIVLRHHLAHAIAALRAAHPYEEPAYDIIPLANQDHRAGLGAVGKLPEPILAVEFLQLVKRTLGAPCLRYCEGKSQAIERVAVCGGSGSSLIAAALSAGAEAYVTADLKYHDFQPPQGQMLLIDAGHRETELLAVDLLYGVVERNFTTFALHRSSADRHPVRYLL